MIVDQRVVITRGHYAGRPGIIREVYGRKCSITLTDTPGPYDVLIKNVTQNDFRSA